MICSTPAYVLRSYDVRETSKIAIFFTHRFGKIKGVLKGIRKDPRKFGSTLPVLSLNHLVFYQKRHTEIHLVSQCDLLADAVFGGADLRRFGLSHRAAELVDQLMPLEDPHASLFHLLSDFLETLKDPAKDPLCVFQVKALALSGFQPHFDSCLGCRQQIFRDAYFSHAQGGLLCSACVGRDRMARPILKGVISTILYIERCGWKECMRLNLLNSVHRQMEELLDCFIHFHVGRPLKSPSVVHELLDL